MLSSDDNVLPSARDPESSADNAQLLLRCLKSEANRIHAEVRHLKARQSAGCVVRSAA